MEQFPQAQRGMSLVQQEHKGRCLRLKWYLPWHSLPQRLVRTVVGDHQRGASRLGLSWITGTICGHKPTGPMPSGGSRGVLFRRQTPLNMSPGGKASLWICLVQVARFFLHQQVQPIIPVEASHGQTPNEPRSYPGHARHGA